MLRRLMLASAHAPDWTPADLAPVIWLDDESAISEASGAVSSWASRGSVVLFTQATTSTMPALITGELAGSRVVRFDGTDDRLLSGSSAAMAIARNVGAAWLCTVARKRTVDVSGVSRIVFRSNGGGTGGVERWILRTGNAGSANVPQMGCRRLDTDSYSTLLAPSALDTSWQIVIMQMDWSACTGILRINGAEVARNSALTTSGLTSNTAPSKEIAIGGHPDVGGNYADVDLAGMLAGNGGALPSLADIQKLEGWCAHRWGLSTLLPSVGLRLSITLAIFLPTVLA